MVESLAYICSRGTHKGNHVLRARNKMFIKRMKILPDTCYLRTML